MRVFMGSRISAMEESGLDLFYDRQPKEELDLVHLPARWNIQIYQQRMVVVDRQGGIRFWRSLLDDPHRHSFVEESVHWGLLGMHELSDPVNYLALLQEGCQALIIWDMKEEPQAYTSYFLWACAYDTSIPVIYGSCSSTDVTRFFVYHRSRFDKVEKRSGYNWALDLDPPRRSAIIDTRTEIAQYLRQKMGE